MRRSFTHNAWAAIGRALFWISWPLIGFMLSRDQRARVVVVHDGQVLVNKSWLGDGTWQLPGGGRHAGETLLACARRELYEETGLDVPEAAFHRLRDQHLRRYGFTFNYALFGVRLERSASLRRQRLEILELAWLPRRGLHADNMHADVLSALDTWWD